MTWKVPGFDMFYVISQPFLKISTWNFVRIFICHWHLTYFTAFWKFWFRGITFLKEKKMDLFFFSRNLQLFAICEICNCNYCKILTFSLRKIGDSTLTQAVSSWLNFDSNSIQLTQLWLKWQSAWFDSDSTHILDFHGRLDSDSTHLSQSRVKFDSRLMSRPQPCYQGPQDSRSHQQLPFWISGPLWLSGTLKTVRGPMNIAHQLSGVLPVVRGPLIIRAPLNIRSPLIIRAPLTNRCPPNCQGPSELQGPSNGSFQAWGP